jgi:hypothetical protein
MYARPDFEFERPHPIDNGLRGIDGSSWPIECREEPVTHGLDLTTAEARQLGADEAVM